MICCFLVNNNFECDWLIELSVNKLSDNNLARELVENRSFFKPITIEEIIIFMITFIIALLYGFNIFYSNYIKANHPLTS